MVGVPGWGGGHRVAPGGDRFVRVDQLTGALEPGPQRIAEAGQVRGAVGVLGWGRGHSVAEQLDCSIKQVEATRPLVVAEQVHRFVIHRDRVPHRRML